MDERRSDQIEFWKLHKPYLYIKNRYGGLQNFIEATNCGLSMSTIRRFLIEGQEITFGNLVRLAKALDVPLGAFAEAQAKRR